MVDHIKCLTEVDQYTPDLQEEPLLAGKTYSRQVLLLLLLVYRPVFFWRSGFTKGSRRRTFGVGWYKIVYIPYALPSHNKSCQSTYGILHIDYTKAYENTTETATNQTLVSEKLKQMNPLATTCVYYTLST